MRILIVVLLFCTSVSADLLTAPRNKFEVARSTIEKKYSETQVKAGEHYLKTLRAMVVYMNKNGDEFGVRPAEAEIKRYMAERTIPDTPPTGTPELVGRAQEKYHEAVKDVVSKQHAEIDELASRYLTSLQAVRHKLQAGGRIEDAGLVMAEIERVQTLGSGAAKPAASLRLPHDAAKHIVLAYDFEERENRKIRDLSGRRRHGDVLGAERVDDATEGATYEFKRDNDMVEIEPMNLGLSWTLIMRVKFPLEKTAGPRVLASYGYRQHHLMIDASGELGLTADTLAGSSYNVNNLKGWHDIAVVSAYTKTLFYVDGKMVGGVPTVCKEPIKTFGNSGAGGRPCATGICSVQLFRSSFSNDLIAEMFKQL